MSSFEKNLFSIIFYSLSAQLRDLRGLLTDSSATQIPRAVSKLVSLHFVAIKGIGSASEAYTLSSAAKSAFTRALSTTSPLQWRAFNPGRSSSSSKGQVKIRKASTKALEELNEVMLAGRYVYDVSSGKRKEKGAFREALRWLERVGLLWVKKTARAQGKGTVAVAFNLTARGYEFVLMERAKQVWFLADLFFKRSASSSESKREFVVFICSVCRTEPGKALRYELETCNDATKKMLKSFISLFARLGAFYERKEGSEVRVLASFSGRPLDSGDFVESRLVCEKSFRVFLFTRSFSFLRCVKLFVETEYEEVDGEECVFMGKISEEYLEKQKKEIGISKTAVLRFLEKWAEGEIVGNLRRIME